MEDYVPLNRIIKTIINNKESIKEEDMDLSLILTIVGTGVGTGVAIIGANIALFSWIRSDMKSFETKIETDLKSFETKIEGWKEEINKESRDFHGRLCSLESRWHSEKAE